MFQKKRGTSPQSISPAGGWYFLSEENTSSLNSQISVDFAYLSVSPNAASISAWIVFL